MFRAVATRRYDFVPLRYVAKARPIPDEYPVTKMAKGHQVSNNTYQRSRRPEKKNIPNHTPSAGGEYLVAIGEMTLIGCRYKFYELLMIL
jgi:hypothetical protein